MKQWQSSWGNCPLIATEGPGRALGLGTTYTGWGANCGGTPNFLQHISAGFNHWRHMHDYSITTLEPPKGTVMHAADSEERGTKTYKSQPLYKHDKKSPFCCWRLSSLNGMFRTVAATWTTQSWQRAMPGMQDRSLVSYSDHPQPSAYVTE